LGKGPTSIAYPNRINPSTTLPPSLREEVWGKGIGGILIPDHGFLTTSLWSRSPYLIDRVRKGKVIPAIDGGRNLMTPVYAGDAAEWVLRALVDPAAAGQVFSAVGGEIVLQKRYYQAIADALGKEMRPVTVPSPVLMRRFSRPPQFSWHRPYSCQKAADQLNYAPQATIESMIRETVEHMIAHDMVRDYAEDPFDDQLVELFLRHEGELEALLGQKEGKERR
jgi:hypothetical protein